MLKKNDVDWIVLAGFLLKIPESYIVDFPQKIINIHPSLLPKFWGKGMYGKHVHKAVIDSGDKEAIRHLTTALGSAQKQCQRVKQAAH